MLIIPAIDLRGGKCVRLAQGDYARETVYDDDPVRVAWSFHAQGAEWLHVVDLDGAKSGAPVNLELVRAIAREVPIRVELGGGLTSDEYLRAALDAGAQRLVLGSALVKNPAFAERAFHTFGEAIVAGIDARDGKVAVTGWTETSEVDAAEMARRVEAMGARRIILTDIAKDGMLSGPNLELLRTVGEAVGVPIIQSGGVSGVDDAVTLAKLPKPPEGVIVGRAIYEGRFDVEVAIAAVDSAGSVA